MAAVTTQVNSLNPRPFLSTYSGFVIPDSSGNAIIDVRDIQAAIVAGFLPLTSSGDMTTSGSNATAAAFGNLVTASTVAIARTSLGLGTADSPVFTSETLSSMTQGSIPFFGAGGLVSQDNSNFFWDAANHRLGIGITSPGAALTVNEAAVSTQIQHKNTSAANTLNNVLFNQSLLTTVQARTAFQITTSFSNVTDATRTSQVNFLTQNNGSAANNLVLLGNKFGIGGMSPIATLSIGPTAAGAQSFNTFTDASNYENAYMGDFSLTPNIATYGTGKAGTGSTRGVQFLVGGTAALTLDASGRLLVADAAVQTVPGASQLQVYNASGGSGIWAISPSGGQATIGVYDKTVSHVGAYLESNNGYAGIATIDNAGAFTAEPLRISPTGITAIGTLTATGLLTLSGETLLATSTALTNGAAAQAGTLLNAPTAGNPTKWIPINDNGTTRYIPAW